MRQLVAESVTAERRASKQIDQSPIRGRASTLPNRHSLLGQLLLRMLVLGEMRQTHATQHIGSLGKLDVVVADDLDAVAPGVAKVQEGSISRGDSCGVERPASRLLVVDHEAKMAAIVGRLLTTLLQGYELVAQIDEGHGLALSAQFEGEEAAIER